MSEKPSSGGATPEKPTVRAHVAEAKRQIAAGEPIDQPTAPAGEGFEVKEVLRLPDQTPEEVEAVRQTTAGPSSYTAAGTPVHRVGNTALNPGGKRERS